MKKILFPTAFASYAPEVFKYAVELAYVFNAPIIFLHAYGKPEYDLASGELMERRKNKVMDNMMKFVQTHLPKEYRAQIKIGYVGKIGYPNKVILEVAAAEEVDVIVMGMTGQVNTLETIFGTTSKHILDKAECPVLAIPSTAKFDGIKSIVYPANFGDRDLEGMNYLKLWSSTFNATIHCTHISENKEKELLAKENIALLRNVYKEPEMINFEVISGILKKVIDGYATSKKADVIAIMSHKRNFVERLLASNTVKDIARNTSIPLLVIKNESTKLNNEMEKVLELVQVPD